MSLIRVSKSGNLIIPPSVTFSELKVAYLNFAYRNALGDSRQEKVADAARRTGLSERTIYTHLKDGKIDAR